MKVKWFGESWGAPVNDDCEQVPIPVGELCANCDELIEADGQGVMLYHLTMDDAGYRPYHYECHMRTVLGSLGHQLGVCSCPGNPGTMDDPPGVSRRLASKLAVDYFESTQRFRERNRSN